MAEGQLDLHSMPELPTMTPLVADVALGASTILVDQAVEWQVRSCISKTSVA